MNKFDRENIMVSFKDEEPVFYVNVKKKTIVCKLNGIILTPEADDWMAPGFNFNRGVSVTGIARCYGDDVFDVARGKRIALAKAENKAYEVAAARVNDVLEDFHFLLEAGNNFIKKASACVNHNNEYINLLSDVNNPDYIAEAYEPKRGETIIQNVTAKKNKK